MANEDFLAGLPVNTRTGTFVPQEGCIPVKAYQTTAEKPFHGITTTPFTPHLYCDREAVDIDAAREGHEYMGLGVSMTDASCWLLAQMPAAKRRELLDAVFSPRLGAGLSMVRLNIGSSDYSTALYNYNENPGDVAMEKFSVARDERHLIPMVREALAVNPDMYVFASPWSPPGWMKDTGSFVKGNFKDGCEPAMANYLAAYVREFARRGVRVNAVNVQNEADIDAGGKYPGCIYTPRQEAEVAKLFAARAKAEKLDTEVWIWDHNYHGAIERVPGQLTDPELRAAIGGVAWHSYTGEPWWMRQLHERYPDIPFYHTEMGPSLSDPKRTERWWCDTVFKVFNNGCRSFTSWNLCLTADGQPATGPLCCGGLLTVDPDSGEFVPSAQYRVFRHIGPFVKRGAKIMFADGDTRGAATVLFRNPSGEYVMVIGCIGTSVPCDAPMWNPRARILIKFRGEMLSLPLPYNTWSLTTVVFG